MRVCNNLARSSIRLGITFFVASTIHDKSETIQRLLAEYCVDGDQNSDAAEDRRKAARDMLRNGTFKPTGRSKPASEYLLRTVLEQGPAGFPQINPVVDVANFISLTTQTPISLWDLEKADALEMNFRYGAADEEYVFNPAGHSIGLRDLALGSIIQENGGTSLPIINPVKDSMRTKTSNDSRRFGLVIYAPQSIFSAEELSSLLDKMSALLAAVTHQFGHLSFVLDPGEMKNVEIETLDDIVS